MLLIRLHFYHFFSPATRKHFKLIQNPPNMFGMVHWYGAGQVPKFKNQELAWRKMTQHNHVKFIKPEDMPKKEPEAVKNFGNDSAHH